MRKLLWGLGLWMALVPVLHAAGPRKVLPRTPSEVWQNDLDLFDEINRRISRSASGSMICIDNPTFCVDPINNRVGIGTTTPADIFQVWLSTSLYLIFTSDGRLGIGGMPTLMTNINEMLHIERASDAGNPSIDTMLWNTGSGGARYQVQSGTSTDTTNLIYVGTGGRGSPGDWWVGGPSVARTSFVQTEGAGKFLLYSDAGDNYFYTSRSSGSWRVYSGGNAMPAIIVSSQGYISKPRNINVSATGSAQTNVTGDGTAYTVQYTNEIIDQTGALLTSTFTAQMEGTRTYQVCPSVLIQQLATVTHTDATLSIVTSNRTYVDDYVSAVGATIDSLDLGKCRNVDMEQDDTLYITVVVNGASKVVDISGSNNSTGLSVTLEN